MQKNNKNTPEGTRDLLYDELRILTEAELRLAEVYEAEGFSQVMTPALEYYDVFDYEGQSLGQEALYKLTDSGGRLLVLRADNTTPIARVAATKLRGQPLPQKLWYKQNVYRLNNGYSGRRNEVIESGVELIGAGGVKSDLACLSVALRALGALGGHFVLEVGHAGFCNAVISRLGLSPEDERQVRHDVSTKNLVSLGFMKNLSGLDKLRKLPGLYGKGEVLDRAAELAEDNADALFALAALRQTYEALAAAGYADRIMLDLGIVHTHDYYTGIVFRGYLDGAGEPVLLGGRYDNLIRQFGRDLPAIGFAINLCLVADALKKNGVCPQKAAADCLIHFAPQDFAAAENLRRRLEKEGRRAELSLFDTYEESAAYARAAGIAQIIDLTGEVAK